MAKQSAAAGVSNERNRDRSRSRDSMSGRFTEAKDACSMKGVRRDILFPSEPSTIGHKKIDRAIEHVLSRKKK
jgi:hypothetical protein